jgi:hypothetical protein
MTSSIKPLCVIFNVNKKSKETILQAFMSKQHQNVGQRQDRQAMLLTFELMVRNDQSSTRPSNFLGADNNKGPPSLDGTEDTSVFELRIDEHDVASIEVVAFQIVVNQTTDSKTPEYITIEDPALRTRHSVIGCNQDRLNNVWAVLDSQSTFQKTYGQLSLPVEVRHDFLMRGLKIRLYEADRQPFNLSDAFGEYDEENPKMFNAFLTIRIDLKR